MPDMYKGSIPIIDDATDEGFFRPSGVGFGCVPRDYNVMPQEMLASPKEMKVIPYSEWDARYDEEERNKSSLEHVYLSGPNGTPAFVNLDQNGDGYCWAYSDGAAIMIDRLKRGLPLVRLNPHSIAAIIKGGRDEGGWCGLSHKFYREVGCAPEGNGPGEWPLHSRNLKYDTPEMRASMARFKIDEDWYDLGRQEWDQKLTEAQSATCSFNNIPGGEDFAWWSHSVCRIRHVRIERNSWGKLILNSWVGFGRYGLAVLRYNSFDTTNGPQGGKAVCAGAVAVGTTTA